MSVQEFEKAAAQLPKADSYAFARWFEEVLADEWDRQIEADALAGRLDKAGLRADENFVADRCKPL